MDLSNKIFVGYRGDRISKSCGGPVVVVVVAKQDVSETP